MVFSDGSSKWETWGGDICYYHFNNKLQGICAKASDDEDISINVGVGGGLKVLLTTFI